MVFWNFSTNHEILTLYIKKNGLEPPDNPTSSCLTKQRLKLIIFNTFAEDTEARSPPNFPEICEKHVLLVHGWSPGEWWTRSKNLLEHIL